MVMPGGSSLYRVLLGRKSIDFPLLGICQYQGIAKSMENDILYDIWTS